MMDNFTYAYQSNKNRLASITNNVTSQTYNYGYDNNGNVISDQYRDISGITYNISNLPEELTANSSLINYWYDNNGNRFRKQDEATDETYVLGKDGETEAVFDVNGSAKFFNILTGNETIGRYVPTPVDLYLNNTTLNGTYEAQNSITVEDNITVSGTATLKAGNNIDLKPDFHSANGSNFTAMIGTVPNIPKRYYYLKDHLGSIRVVVDETGNTVSSDDYDPWGMILDGRSTNNDYVDAKYKFTGKEFDTETNYYHFAARPYDGRIGRWLQIDPLTDESPEISPYVYGNNNPITIVDLFGMDTTFVAQLQPVEVTANRYDWQPSNWWQVFGMAANTLLMYPNYYIYNINKDLSVERKQTGPIPQTTIGIVPGSITGPEGEVIEGAEPIIKNLGAASRAEMLAMKLKLNINSPTTRQLLNNLDKTVEAFIGQFRKASIRAELPGGYLNKTVEEALTSGNTTVRKLLIDNRFVK
jgi:RHS repeat-associated protein